MSAFDVVRQFEAKVAAFAGARYGVAVNSCTNAIFLSLKYFQSFGNDADPVIVPARTFVSVPMAVIHAGMKVQFDDAEWHGVYELYPHNVVDSALRFRKGMYQGGLHCLSFHARKLLNIGEGGMVLTDDEHAYRWLKKACYSGRGSPSFAIEDIEMIGWQMYMTPEKAARGMHILEYLPHDLPDQVVVYPDLRNVKAFQCA